MPKWQNSSYAHKVSIIDLELKIQCDNLSELWRFRDWCKMRPLDETSNSSWTRVYESPIFATGWLIHDSLSMSIVIAITLLNSLVLCESDRLHCVVQVHEFNVSRPSFALFHCHAQVCLKFIPKRHKPCNGWELKFAWKLNSVNWSQLIKKTCLERFLEL